jgi:hypothetical protein
MWHLKKKKSSKPKAWEKNVIPSMAQILKERSEKRKRLLADFRGLHRGERARNIWISDGRYSTDEYFNYIKKVSGVNIPKEIIERFQQKGKIKILELGMGKGEHVPELIKRLKLISPKGKIDFHDLSLTKKLSNENQALLKLEEEGVVHRHKGIFEMFPTKKLENSDVIFSRVGPFYHSEPEFIFDMLVKVSGLLNKNGIAVLDLVMGGGISHDLMTEHFNKNGFIAHINNGYMIVRRRQ